MKAYRQDFIAIASLITDGDPARLAVTDITKDSMRSALAAYARDHEASSIRRCSSTWNVLSTFLYTSEQLAANPMQLVGRPKLARPLPKALPRTAVEALLETVTQDRGSERQTDWAERDLALIVTGLLAGLRAEELCQADIGDIRTTDDGAAVIHVKGKGGKERSPAGRGSGAVVAAPALAHAEHSQVGGSSANNRPRTSADRSPPSSIANTIARSRCVPAWRRMRRCRWPATIPEAGAAAALRRRANTPALQPPATACWNPAAHRRARTRAARRT